jgi:CPA1 family monovalent cation:H+ antiporter
MPAFQVVLGMLVAVAGLGILARHLGLPHPIVLVLGGLLLALVPGVPTLAVPPDLVFLLFLPPLVYIAAFNTSIRDFRAQARPIARLAIGLVLATIVGVAAAIHAVLPDLGWAAAFVLGAIVSPSDAVAATSILRQLGVPRSMITLLEGESLLNDATGLVAYRFAVAATVTGAYSLLDSAASFVLVGVAGVAIGLAVGWLVGRLRRQLNDAPVEITISLLTPFAAYLPADALGASGVLACVACGAYVGRQSGRIMEPSTRLQGRAVWEMLVFVFNGLLFLLMGLELPSSIAQLGTRSLLDLVGLGLLVSACVVLIRFGWVFLTDLPRLLRRDAQARAEVWRQDVVVSWAGMRGVVSLAAALALPFTAAGGAAFPERHLLIFLTVCVILTTLVGQGLSLPWLLRRLRLVPDGVEDHEEAFTREVANQAAQARLEELTQAWPTHLPLIETLRAQLEHRASHFEDHVDDQEGRHPARTTEADQELIEHRAIRHAVIDAQRQAILELRDTGQIGDDTLRSVERDLDLEELRTDA